MGKHQAPVDRQFSGGGRRGQGARSDHARGRDRFHNWWVDRIATEELGRNAANKQIGQVSKILHVVGDEIKLNLGPLFAGLALDERKQKRPPFPREFVEKVLLRPGALFELNLEARAALLLCAETGMGTEEVTSLLPDQIHLGAKVPYISIVSREGAAQKTEYRPRDLPLVGVALMAARACPNGIRRYAGRPASLSALINKFLPQHKLLPSESHSLYSLRHAFQDRLTEAEAPDRLQADLMGHNISASAMASGRRWNRSRIGWKRSPIKLWMNLVSKREPFQAWVVGKISN